MSNITLKDNCLPKGIDVCLLAVRIYVSTLQHLRTWCEYADNLRRQVVELCTRNNKVLVLPLEGVGLPVGY